MIYIVCRNNEPRVATFTEAAAMEAMKQQIDLLLYAPLVNFTVHKVPVEHRWNLPMFTPPMSMQELVNVRHDKMQGFNSALGTEFDEDYAGAMSDIEFAMSHLREGLPNGQAMRVRTAMRALMRGAFTLLKFLTKRGVMKE